jgi:uncharacterized repeat protein (TIGR03803 family)
MHIDNRRRWVHASSRKGNLVLTGTNMSTEKLACDPARAAMLFFAPERIPKWRVGKLGGWRSACAVCLLCAAAAIASPAQTFTTLFNFNGLNEIYPATLIQGADGRLWGTTYGKGPPNCGIVFKLTRAGGLSKVFTFNCVNGDEASALTLGTDGNFYGTAFFGGTHSEGTVFKLKPGSALTQLASFDGTDGAGPLGNLAQGADGNFYGATYGGGNTYDGTIFQITPKGILTKLVDFDSVHGSQPYAGPIRGTDGDFYGTTYSGGAYGVGVVYKFTPKGALSVLHDFGEFSTDGDFPVTSLVQASDGSFYGTTPYGGPDNDGTAFKITPNGTFTNLYNFFQSDASPATALVQATDGNFYGMTSFGGASGKGTIFKMTAAGTVTTLHSFDGTDGSAPVTLMQATDGAIYGLTSLGGASNEGTVFRLSVGLRPFVEMLPTMGRVGTRVTILGTNLTGATSVSFNGTAAKFTVVSSSEITTTVPTGATTGKVKVAIPKRTLSSNVRFRVTK